ncbi:hypothetical protein BGZ63DRAFT_409587 [Mariannaea sp. PMI_226]|nr:hypothetical protein BGZ63DRAFT_409587 [Mariannaea sp. PMI_226]
MSPSSSIDTGFPATQVSNTHDDNASCGWIQAREGLGELSYMSPSSHSPSVECKVIVSYPGTNSSTVTIKQREVLNSGVQKKPPNTVNSTDTTSVTKFKTDISFERIEGPKKRFGVQCTVTIDWNENESEASFERKMFLDDTAQYQHFEQAVDLNYLRFDIDILLRRCDQPETPSCFTTAFYGVEQDGTPSIGPRAASGVKHVHISTKRPYQAEAGGTQKRQRVSFSGEHLHLSPDDESATRERLD